MASRSPSPGTPGATDLSGNRVPKFNNGWTKEQEELMAGWADIAACYRWMHDRCEKIMARSNMWITVPVIILSTLTGSANFMLQSVVGDDKDIQKYAQIGIGGVSIFTGILTTLGNFFRFAQSSEAHRVAGVAWGKFQRQLAVELALHPKERIDCMDFLKICRAELDRLIEQSPPIPDQVIEAFEKEFKEHHALKKPDIAHGMDHTKVFNNNEERVKKMAADAAIMIKQKRKVWHEAMMPDVDRHVDVRLKKAVTDLSGTLFTSLENRIKELENQAKQKLDAYEEEHKHVVNTAHIKSFVRTTPGIRGRSLTSRINRPLAQSPRVSAVTPVPVIAAPPAPPSPQTPLAERHVDVVVPAESTPITSDHLISALTDANFTMRFHTDPEEQAGGETIVEVPPETVTPPSSPREVP